MLASIPTYNMLSKWHNFEIVGNIFPFSHFLKTAMYCVITRCVGVNFGIDCTVCSIDVLLMFGINCIDELYLSMQLTRYVDILCNLYYDPMPLLFGTQSVRVFFTFQILFIRFIP